MVDPVALSRRGPILTLAAAGAAIWRVLAVSVGAASGSIATVLRLFEAAATRVRAAIRLCLAALPARH